MMTILLMVFVGILLSTPLIIGIVYRSASTDKQLTFVPTGEIKFVDWGKTIKKVLMNVPGKYYVAKTDTIEDTPSVPTGSRLLHKLMRKFSHEVEDGDGIYYVSAIYPLRRVRTWKFEWARLVARTKQEGETDKVLEDYSVVQKTAVVNSLYYQYQYPVLVKEIELRGNFMISVLLRVTLTVRKPIYLVGILKGNWMAQAVSEIKGIVDNGCRPHDVDEFRALDRKKLIESMFPSGSTILNGAIEVTETAYVGFDYSGNSQQVIDAVVANQIEEEQGNARITKETKDAEAAKKRAEATVTAATAEATGIRLLGEGKAAALKAVLEAAKSQPGGNEVYMVQETASAIKDFKATGALVIGEGKGTLLSLNRGTPTTATKENAA